MFSSSSLQKETLLSIFLQENATREEIEASKDMQATLIKMIQYQGTINNPILFLCSIYVIYVVICLRRRYEMFLVLVPILMCL